MTRQRFRDDEDNIIEYGETIFDDREADDPEDIAAERAFWHNRAGSDGWAPSDFDYDPLSRRGFE